MENGKCLERMTHIFNFCALCPGSPTQLSPSQKLKRLTPSAPLRRLITCIEVLKAHFSQGRILQADRPGAQNTHPITKDCLRLKESFQSLCCEHQAWRPVSSKSLGSDSSLSLLSAAQTVDLMFGFPA